MQIDYIVHESEMARMERANKRWFIAWLITFLLLCACVCGFIWYENQFTDEVITQEVLQEVSGESSRNYFAGGDLYGSSTESTDNNKTENP